MAHGVEAQDRQGHDANSPRNAIAVDLAPELGWKAERTVGPGKNSKLQQNQGDKNTHCVVLNRCLF